MNRFVSVVAGILLTGMANATLVDFSTMPNQANYTGNGDFTVTTYGGPETDASLSPHISGGRLVNSSDPADVSAAYPTEDIIDFDFLSGMDSVIVDMYWAGDPTCCGSTGATITSFDIAGNILEQFGYNSSINAVYTFDSVDLIYSIQTSTNLTTREDWWYGINSIEYTAVPAPASLALLVLGLVGMRVAKRRQSA